MEIFEVAIIGAGPAGIAAGIQLKRYGISFSLIERDEPGGLLRNANLVENYPGFPEGITGRALVKRMLAQMKAEGVQLLHTEVTGVAYDQGGFYLQTTTGELRSRFLVIASGTKPRKFIKVEIPANGRGLVHYEVHSLIQVQNKHVVIVGAGDAAFDYALNLARHNQVTILNRNDHIHCLPLLWKRALQSTRIKYLANTLLSGIKIVGEGKISLECQTVGENFQLEADYLLGALGREPQIDFIAREFEPLTGSLEAKGLLYWIGDVHNGRYRQTAIAVGEGVRAAMKIYQSLQEETW